MKLHSLGAVTTSNPAPHQKCPSLFDFERESQKANLRINPGRPALHPLHCRWPRRARPALPGLHLRLKVRVRQPGGHEVLRRGVCRPPGPQEGRHDSWCRGHHDRLLQAPGRWRCCALKSRSDGAGTKCSTQVSACIEMKIDARL